MQQYYSIKLNNTNKYVYSKILKRQHSTLSPYIKSKKNGTLLYNIKYIKVNPDNMNGDFISLYKIFIYNISLFMFCLKKYITNIVNFRFDENDLFDERRLYFSLAFRVIAIVISYSSFAYIFFYFKLSILAPLVFIFIFILWTLSTTNFTKRYINKIYGTIFIAICLLVCAILFIYIPLCAYLYKDIIDSGIYDISNISPIHLFTNEVFFMSGKLLGYYLVKTGSILSQLATSYLEKHNINGPNGPNGPNGFEAGILFLLNKKSNKEPYYTDWTNKDIVIEDNKQSAQYRLKDVDQETYDRLNKKYNLRPYEVKRLIGILAILKYDWTLDKLADHMCQNGTLCNLYAYPSFFGYPIINTAELPVDKQIATTTYGYHPAYDLATIITIVYNNQLPEVLHPPYNRNQTGIMHPYVTVRYVEVEHMLSTEFKRFISYAYLKNPKAFYPASEWRGTNMNRINPLAPLINSKCGWNNINSLLKERYGQIKEI